MSESAQLNPQQQQAVLHKDGPLLILAGAGAGKTKTITHRILQLIKQGIAPHQILAVTFTNKAASEMRERVLDLIANDRDLNLPISFREQPFLSTFHSLGVSIIKENATLLGLPRHFSIFDRSESMSLIKKAVKEAELDPKQFEPAKFLSIISKQKGNGVSLSDYEGKGSENYLDKLLFVIWQKYESGLKKEKALDFDDLLLTTKNLLERNESVREHYQNTWKYIHIDEYQDTNRVQYEIAKLLAAKNKNICVVGDIDQSIYSWRGADFKNIMRFEKDYPDATVILLEENYRSTQKILAAANAIIEKNTLRKDKVLFTKNEPGESISLYGSYDEAGEASYIARKINELVTQDVKTEDIAILYRANFQSRAIEEAMLSNSIPYQVLGVRFFERKEVKDILAYLRAALSQEENLDFKRIINTPARGIGATTLLKLFAGEEAGLPAKTREKIEEVRALLRKIKQHADSKKLSETIYFIMQQSGLEKFYTDQKEEGEEHLQNMFELISVASKYNDIPSTEATEKFLTEAALASDQDDLKEAKNGVRLMTVHASKGLEFPYVFISGMEEDLFPHAGMRGEKKNKEEQEEERRLFYVALTRARKKIFLTYASVRTVFGNRTIATPSSFIDDIAPEILEQEVSEEVIPRGKIIYLE